MPRTERGGCRPAGQAAGRPRHPGGDEARPRAHRQRHLRPVLREHPRDGRVAGIPLPHVGREVPHRRPPRVTVQGAQDRDRGRVQDPEAEGSHLHIVAGAGDRHRIGRPRAAVQQPEAGGTHDPEGRQGGPPRRREDPRGDPCHRPGRDRGGHGPNRAGVSRHLAPCRAQYPRVPRKAAEKQLFLQLLPSRSWPTSWSP